MVAQVLLELEKKFIAANFKINLPYSYLQNIRKIQYACVSQHPHYSIKSSTYIYAYTHTYKHEYSERQES